MVVFEAVAVVVDVDVVVAVVVPLLSIEIIVHGVFLRTSQIIF
jgi:hypothetical protein